MKLIKGDVIKIISGQNSGLTGVINKAPEGYDVVSIFTKNSDLAIWYLKNEIKKIGSTNKKR